MQFTETKLAGAYIIDLERREDSRGFFARTFCQKEFVANGFKRVIAQANVAYNFKEGALRGMHFQSPPPAAETKLYAAARRDPRYHRGSTTGKPHLSPEHCRRAKRGKRPRALRARTLRARLSGVAETLPKPMVAIGCRPILWHEMKTTNCRTTAHKAFCFYVWVTKRKQSRITS